jgi:hypothetical protein
MLLLFGLQHATHRQLNVGKQTAATRGVRWSGAIDELWYDRKYGRKAGRMEGRKEGRKEGRQKKTHRSAENCLLLHDLVLAHQAVVHQRHEEEQVRRRAAVAPLAAATGLGADRQLSQWPARNSDSATDSDNKTGQSELGRSTTTREKHSPASSTPTRT